MVMIYAFGSISGAHINPAVSIAFVFTDKFNRKDLGTYLTAQLTGAVLASGLLKLLFQMHPNWGATVPFDTWQQPFVLEIILTFILKLVILLVSQNPNTTTFKILHLKSNSHQAFLKSSIK